MNRPVRFKGCNSYLSNFYACRIRVWGREFHTVERAYQWKKCVHNDDRDTAEKMAATCTGLQAKHLSKSIRETTHLRESWNRQRRSVMFALVVVKFRDRYLRKRLLSMGERELIEWVRSKEGFWGALTNDGRTGQNTLGELLMQLREFIRTHQQAKSGSDVKRMRDCNQENRFKLVCTGENITRRATRFQHHALFRNSENIRTGPNSFAAAKTSRAVSQ